MRRFVLASVISMTFSCGEATLGESYANWEKITCDVFVVYASELHALTDEQGDGLTMIVNLSESALPLDSWYVAGSSSGIDAMVSDLVRQLVLPPDSYVGRLPYSQWLDRLVNIAPHVDPIELKNISEDTEIITIRINDEYSEKSFLLNIDVDVSQKNELSRRQRFACGV